MSEDLFDAPERAVEDLPMEQQLYHAVLRALLERVQSPDAKAADVSNAITFLKSYDVKPAEDADRETQRLMDEIAAKFKGDRAKLQ